MARRLRVEADGGSRGNPGVAGYGALVRDVATGDLLVELAEPLGTASNNVAEYRGMLAGLTAVVAIDPTAEVEVAMDSKLVVEQMSGRWKIKHEDMRRLALQGRDLVGEIREAGGTVSFTWIPRGENGDADALSNDGMDGTSVARWHTDDEQTRDEGPSAEAVETEAADGTAEATRLLLVVPGGDPTATARQLRGLLADERPQLLTWGGPTGDDTQPLADALDLVAEPQDGPVLDRWHDLQGTGGLVVVVADAEAVRAVLADILDVPAGRRDRLALAAGSVSAVQSWPGEAAVVAFTNRT